MLAQTRVPFLDATELQASRTLQRSGTGLWQEELRLGTGLQQKELRLGTGLWRNKLRYWFMAGRTEVRYWFVAERTEVPVCGRKHCGEILVYDGKN